MFDPISLLPTVFCFALGTVAASFVGVLVGRLHTGESIARGRSKCDSCGVVLTALDLVPVLSYLFARGRARCCKTRISPSSTVTEFVLGVLFALSYIKIGFTCALPFLLVALAALLALVLYDLRHSILPPTFLVVFLVASVGFAFLAMQNWREFLITLLVAGGSALFLALIHVGSRGRAMGLADAPLVFGLALLAGPTALSGLIFSFWVGALVGIIILVRAPKGAKMGIEVPFAPFLAAGFLLAYFTTWNPFTLIGNLTARLIGI